MARKIPKQWVNMQTGEITLEALQYLDDLENGTDSDNPSIGTVLAGVNTVTATTAAILAGEVSLADVVITDLGSVAQLTTAQSANITAVSEAAGASALTTYATPASLYKEVAGSTGPITTDATTVTVVGGTGPFTYAWTQTSGPVFTINSPSSATTTFTRTTIPLGQSRSGQFKCVATDSLAATFEVLVAATVVSTE